jgi:hypothetical protein
MADIFTAVIERLRDIGAFNFLFPYMLTTAIFYGLLRKSQVFGKPEENAAVNAVVAMIAAFMVWSYPVIAGIDIEVHLVYFFTQGMVVMLVFMMTLLIAGMFLPPDLPKHLSEGLLKGNKAAGIIIVGLFFGLVIVISSGLWNAVLGPSLLEVPSDIFITVVVIIILIVPFIFIMWPTKVEKKEEVRP